MIRISVCVLILLLPSMAFAGTPSVTESSGNIFCVNAKGQAQRLTGNGLDTQPVLSPNGHTVAFIRTEGSATQEGQPDFTALWTADCQTLTTSRLLGPKPSDIPQSDLTFMSNPVFSLDGGFVYVMANAWVTSDAIHQVNLKTGQEKYITDGNTLSIVRSGPYRGYILTAKHKYHPNGGGSYNPTVLVKPDGEELLQVPDTDDDETGDVLAAWLKEKGWQAW